MTRTVASNVQVLTAGTRRDQTQSQTEAKGTSVVTLMVTPEDAERIALAQSEGQIMLVLRNPLDQQPSDLRHQDRGADGPKNRLRRRRSRKIQRPDAPVAPPPPAEPHRCPVPLKPSARRSGPMR